MLDVCSRTGLRFAPTDYSSMRITDTKLITQGNAYADISLFN